MLLRLITIGSNWEALVAKNPELISGVTSYKHCTTYGFNGFVAKDGIHGTGICNDLVLYPNQTHSETGITGVWAAGDWHICNYHTYINILYPLIKHVNHPYIT